VAARAKVSVGQAGDGTTGKGLTSHNRGRGGSDGTEYSDKGCEAHGKLDKGSDRGCREKVVATQEALYMKGLSGVTTATRCTRIGLYTFRPLVLPALVRTLTLAVPVYQCRS